MGIDTQVRDPVPREPVELFFYPAYAGDGPEGETDDGCPDDSSSIPATVDARLSPGQSSVPAGTLVFILSLESGTATLWVTVPTPRCIGRIVEPQAQQIARACRTAVGGLTGIVVAGGTGGHDDGLRVQIRAA